MNSGLKTLIAGGLAWKFGGGLFTAILLFVLIFWLLGKL